MGYANTKQEIRVNVDDDDKKKMEELGGGILTTPWTQTRKTQFLPTNQVCTFWSWGAKSQKPKPSSNGPVRSATLVHFLVANNLLKSYLKVYHI